MTPEQWQHVQTVFHAALERPSAERAAFVSAACRGDDTVRREVDSLLAVRSEAHAFLEQPVHDVLAGDEAGATEVSLVPGSRLGTFEILDVAGHGGMGEVYRARDVRLDRLVALKLLPPRTAFTPQARARLQREARSISRLNHPHICTLYDVGAASPGEGSPEVPFLVMEYLDGETLAQRLQHGPLPVADVLRHGIALAGALAAAHEAGIVHRDLKPGNVMLVKSGADRNGPPDAKLLDFGLARSPVTAPPCDAAAMTVGHVDLSTPGIIAGTWRYMSPEQVRGEDAGPQSDIFSFGSLLYEMVTGGPAFTGATPEEIARAVIGVDPPPVRQREPLGPLALLRRGNVPRHLETVITRCLQKAPDHRFPRMHDVQARLEEIRGPRHTAPWAGGHPARAQRAVVIAALAIAAGAAVALRLLPREPASAPQAGMKTVQLTALNGLELTPTFSPDGYQVAFSWNGEREDNFDIYVMTVGSSEVRRLTTDPLPDVLPTWSRDGHRIAFLREQRDGGSVVHAVSPAGENERPLSGFRVGAGPSARIAWSPDGRAIVGRPDLTEDLAKQGSWALHLIPLGSGTPRRLTTARGPDLDLAPAFSPDGRHLAYAACTAFATRPCDVNVVDLEADYTPMGPPRRVAPGGMRVSGLAWSGDGTSLVYDTDGRGRWELWRVKADGSAEAERLEVPGDHARQPAIVPARDRLAFERHVPLRSVYRLQSHGDPMPVLVSSAWDHNPQFSPDGRRIAFSSRRSGATDEIWMASGDGSGARQLTFGPGSRQSSPAWSPDGRWIAFESTGASGRSDIWVIASTGGTPRQITTDPGEENMQTWSRDGRRIYFLSERGGGSGMWGGHDTWQVAAAGGPSSRVTEGGSGLLAYESPDGTALIYQRLGGGDSALLIVPLEGGPPRELLSCVRAFSFFVGRAGVYYSPCGSRRDLNPVNGLLQTWPPRSAIPLHFLELPSGRVRVLGTVTAPFDPTRLAVSPDGQTILVHRNVSVSDLMMVENFQ